MQILQTFAGLFSNFGNLTWQMVVMWVIGGLLIYLAIVMLMTFGLRKLERRLSKSER